MIKRRGLISILTVAFIVLGVALSEGKVIDSSHPAETFLPDSLPTGYPVIHSLGINAGIDYVATSVGDEIREKTTPLNSVKVNTAVPVNLRYSFTLTDPHIPHYLEGGYQGISVGVLNFGAGQAHGFDKATRNIGYPVLAYIFQGGPFHKFNERWSLNYEWNFGAAIGWKPYGDGNKYFNLIVGSQVNAYLNIGMNARWQLNRHTALYGGVSVSHFSNGNTSFPNPGVNSFGVRLGMEYILNPKAKSCHAGASAFRTNEDTVRKRRLEYDIMAWGSTRKRLYRGMEPPVLLPGHYATAGFSFAPMVRLNRWWRVGGSLDLQWDKSSNMKRHYISGDTTEDIKFSTPSFWSQSTVGVSVHGELQMPVFAVNIGCGYNLVAPWENRGSYQNIALKAYVWRGLFLNIGYQLRNFKQQCSLMLGAGVTI